MRVWSVFYMVVHQIINNFDNLDVILNRRFLYIYIPLCAHVTSFACYSDILTSNTYEIIFPFALQSCPHVHLDTLYTTLFFIRTEGIEYGKGKKLYNTTLCKDIEVSLIGTNRSKNFNTRSIDCSSEFSSQIFHCLYLFTKTLVDYNRFLTFLCGIR